MRSRQGVIFLANHPAEVDPIILTTLLWGKYKTHPVAADFVFHIPGVRWCVAKIGTIPIPGFDLTTNSFKKRRIEKTYETISDLLKRGENILVYPSGILKTSARESLGGASGTFEILQRAPEAKVVLVRTTGLWGSIFSKAVTGKRPDLVECFVKGFKVLLKNLFLFTPRREVTIEFKEVSDSFPRKGERQEINQYMETWFNAQGEEPLKLVSFAFWKKEFPALAKRPKERKFLLSAVPQDVQDRVLQEVSNLSKIPVKSLSPEQNFAQDLGLDSLDKSQLALVLKEQFGVNQLNSADLTTIESMMAYAAHLKQGSAEEEKAQDKKSLWGLEKDRPDPVYPESETLIEGFLEAADRMGKYLAAADLMSGEVTYSRLKLGVILFALYLKDLPGDKVGVMLPASIAVDVAMLACQLAGKVPVMINWTLGERNLKSIIEQTGIQATLSSWKFLDRLSNTELGPLNDQLILLEEVRFSFSLKTKLRAMMLAKRNAKSVLRIFDARKLKKDNLAVILFTSGTESYPKGVPLSHHNVMENQRAAAKLISLTKDDVMFGILPPFHSFGFSVTGMLPLVSGLRVAYCPNPTNGRQIAYGIEHWKGTLFCSAPTFLKTLLRVSKKAQLRTLRLVVTGAERTPEELFAQMRELNPKTQMIEGYGITECAPILTLNRPGSLAKGVGLALPGVELLIVHPDTLETKPQGESGLILAAGPNIFSGYLGGEKSPFLEKDGRTWYETGDLGSLDKAGHLTIEGRLKRFVKIGGEMVSLTMMEEVLQETASKAGWKTAKDAPSFAVVAVENGEDKSSIHLFTVCEVSAEEVNRTLRDQGMSNLIKVQSVQHLYTIPLLGTGKVNYRELTQKLKNTV
ncbi:MAG: AMP-binding protein [Chlamydiales bacterium]|nr:AMP-binding protein [Chlamydiales bacterium]